MNVSLYQAAAAMNANGRWQEMISQNLSASSIPGFKKQEMSFEGVESGRLGMLGKSEIATAPKAMPGVNFTQGELKATGGMTDLGIDGRGFFEIELPGGATAYTRDGEFHLSATGQLVTKEGYAVRGEGGPIQVDRKNGGPISIGPGGDVSQGSQLVGKLKLVEFQNPKALTAISAGYFQSTNSEELPTDVANPSIRQGFLESGNASSVTEMVNLITAMRSFEANQHVIKAQDERMSRAISELGATQ
jgi:flagellar basal-body rod protein FlgF